VTDILLLLNCNAGYDRELVDSIRKVPGVTEASIVVGSYDVIVRVSADSTAKAKDVINRQIKRMAGVRMGTALIRK
jgi:DNA-binding Lrp family transcriptional regulator